jgi:hypothetical protein
MLAIAPACTRAATLPKRWVYLATNLLVDANVTKDIAFLNRAHGAGYTGVLVGDSKFMLWDRVGQHYIDNCQKLRAVAKQLGMEFVAAVAPVGYSNDLLSRDPNLAEGLPVVDAPFVATSDGHLLPQSESPLVNGNFESQAKGVPTGWSFVDQPGKISTVVKEDGRTALRMSEIGRYDPTNGHARAAQTLHLRPFRYYHVSAWVKTEGFESADDCRILALGRDGRNLQQSNLPILRSMPWTKVDVTFNTLDNSDVTFYIGCWGGKGGTIWWNDVKIEPAGLVNLVRRSGAPFSVKSATGVTYAEHKDFDNAVDPKLGNHSWPGDFDVWHAGPTLTVPAGSRIRSGDFVLVSYYHTALIYGGQAMCCMAEPETMQIIKWQLAQVHQYLQPDGYMLNHDEIRMTGWDESCRASGKSPAELLADNVRQCIHAVRQEDPGKQVYAWSDMFDPNHNSKKTGAYYLVKGDGPWFGSWKGLDKDVVILNWNSDPNSRKASLEFFEKLGCRQILAGYYDSPPDRIKPWLADAANTSGVVGVMYTTWVGNFADLEKFMAALPAK